MRNAFGIANLPAVTSCLTCFIATALFAGCGREPEVVQYTIDPQMPSELRNDTRMLGAIMPQESDVWFFKLTGDAATVEEVAEEYRRWSAGLQFEQGLPVLDLPDGWSQKPASAMRHATIEIPVGEPPLEVSVSKLPKREAWAQVVDANVNRWRNQLGLQPSEERWAGAEVLTGADTEEPSIWVDIIGETGGGMSTPASPPFASQMGPAMVSGTPPSSEPSTPSSADAPIEYTKPESWEVGRTSSMRWAAFTIGSDDRSAEITVIPAGGDLRGNIQRWLGQIRPEGVTDEDVEAVISKATELSVDGITSQRFLMTGTGEAPQAIDATIVPLGEGFSLFIKMTGEAETVAAESDRIQQFLDSLKLNS